MYVSFRFSIGSSEIIMPGETSSMKQLRFIVLRHVRNYVLICLLASALPAILSAQSSGQTNPAKSPPPASATAGSSSGAAESNAPEPAPTTIVEYAPRPAQYARAKAYSRAHYRHFFINTLYGLLLLLVVLRWRLAPTFRDLAERISARRFVQTIVFAPLILLTIAI